MKWIIVGLGNPEPEYKDTRHNAGRAFVNTLRESGEFSEWEFKRSYDAYVAKGMIADHNVLLMTPQTFMNGSGNSLVTLVKSPRAAQHLIVVYDDLALPLGKWKISWDRSAGGHNGVSSIIKTIRTKEFIRVRIGIAPLLKESEVSGGDVSIKDLVLEKFQPSERNLLNKTFSQILEGIDTIISEGYESAMTHYN